MIHLAARQPQPGFHMLGIDCNCEAIDKARRSAQGDHQLEFRQHALSAAIPLADATVDVAYSHNLIECLSDISLFVRELARVLRPDGRSGCVRTGGQNKAGEIPSVAYFTSKACPGKFNIGVFVV